MTMGSPRRLIFLILFIAVVDIGIQLVIVLQLMFDSGLRDVRWKGVFYADTLDIGYHGHQVEKKVRDS